jgi:signal transduction histidine kinase/ligand-binding sensor domain-containing protein
MRLLTGIALTALLLLRSGTAVLALDPSLRISQYAHTAWTVRDGVFKDPIGSIAQTPDGYLWLGTQFGLLRFDGVRHVLWQPPAGQHLPSINIRSVFAARDGRLWIGTQLGLASWKDGTLTVHREVTGVVGSMLEDRHGTVWAGTRSPAPGTLCAFRRDGVQCYGDEGEFGARASSVYEDRAGNLWVGSEDALWRWKPGPSKRYPLVSFESSHGIVETDEGALVIAERDKLTQLVGEGVVEYHPWVTRLNTQFAHMLRDRDGALWIGTLDRGLIRVHRDRVDLFSRADGLSSNYVRGLLEDREGNIWVATDNGLDRFRHTAVTTISANHGLSEGTPWSVLPASDGSVWVGTVSGLNRLRDGRITVYRRDGRPLPQDLAGPARRVVNDAGLPHDLIHSLFEDHRQRIWVSTHRGVVVFEHGRFRPIAGLPSGVQAFAGDAADNIWVSEDATLTHVVDQRVVERIPWTRLGSRVLAGALLYDPVGGGLWLGFRDGSGVAYVKEGRVVVSYNAANGLGRGIVGALHLDRDGTLWASTEGGLSRIKSGRVHTLSAKEGLPCDAVHWAIEDDTHAFWLYTACGLARVARSDVDAWAVDVEKDGVATRRVEATVLDHADGVRIHAMPGNYTPQVGKSRDGRIWFLPWDGVSVLDPGRLRLNVLPPPVHVEQITADRQMYAAASDLRLPRDVRDVSIDFTALSFVAPEKIRFRYILEGQDPEWKEVVNDRRAHYSNLPPGQYRFRVVASNNSGVWNEKGASLQFAIAPAYYETRWFQAVCAAAIVGLFWAAHRLHVRHVVRQLNLTVEARVDERTRIARELHDTLLQGFQGLLLMFHSALKLLPDRPVEARQRLERALEQATAATTEARHAVQGLRASSVETTDPAGALWNIVAELTREQEDSAPAIRVTAQGTPRRLKPVVGDEVYRITREALRNALRHAAAQHITAEIRYDERRFRVRVRDDGRGFDQQAVRRDPPAGHFGLHGMRERAEKIGGSLDVWSKPEFGTEIVLSIPAAIAYAPSSERGIRAALFGSRSARPSPFQPRP